VLPRLEIDASAGFPHLVVKVDQAIEAHEESVEDKREARPRVAVQGARPHDLGVR